MKFSFPSEVVVTLNKVEGHPSPPEDFRKKMMVALKDFFNEKLEEEPWDMVQATLWYVVQRLPLFKEKRMMVKLKNIVDDRDAGLFDFKVFLSKRPEVYPTWNLDGPESDDEEAPADPFFCMQVNVTLVTIDSLQKNSGLVVSKLVEQNQPLLLKGRPMPKTVVKYVQNLTSKDLSS